MRVIERRVVDPKSAVEYPVDAVFVNRRIPALPVVGRFDQRKSQIAQPALVLGQIVIRYRRAGAARGVAADPVMDAVAGQIRLQPAQIADARTAGKSR